MLCLLEWVPDLQFVSGIETSLMEETDDFPLITKTKYIYPNLTKSNPLFIDETAIRKHLQSKHNGVFDVIQKQEAREAFILKHKMANTTTMYNQSITTDRE